MEELELLVELARKNAWYPMAGVMTMLVVEAQKRGRLSALWGRVPESYRWLIPLGMAGLAGFAKGYSEGSNLRQAAIEGIITLALSGPLSMGYNAGLSNSAAPWPPSRKTDGTDRSADSGDAGPTNKNGSL